MPQTNQLTTRGQKTRQRLLDAASDLLAREPAASIGLERIARAAGVAKSSVLWHFGSKEQLYLEVVDRWFGSMQASIVAELDSGRDLREVLPELLEAYARFLREQPEANVVLFTLLFGAPKDSGLRPRIAEMYRAFRQAIVDHTHVRGRATTEAEAALVVAALDGVFLQGFIDPDRFDADATFGRLRELVER